MSDGRDSLWFYMDGNAQMKIQFVDLGAQQKRIRDKVEARIKKVLDHGQYIMGPEVAELEAGLAAYAGAKHCISCSSGTDALLMALMAYDIKPGDALITTPFTFIATAEVVALLGATPVFADIDPATFNINPALVSAAADKARGMGLIPRGIIPVDLFGLPADFDGILETARQRGLFVLDDAAQGFGGIYKGKKVGSIGDISATSFFPAKPLGCYGDGGAVFTEDDGLADKMVSIRIHGKGNDKYDNIRVGINGRMDTLQAAIMIEKLAIFEEEIVMRQKVAAAYTEALADVVEVPAVPQGYRSAWAQYSVLSDRRETIMKACQEAGIPIAVYYPKPLHMQTAFKYLGCKPGDFPESQRAAERIFSLPMHPYLKDGEMGYITDTIRRAATRK